MKKMMFAADRREMIESYGHAINRLEAAMRGFPRQMWTYRPDELDWTIHEILIHLADSEAHGYLRCRRLIAEPGSDILGYDEAEWAGHLNYHAQNPDDALALFRLLRRMTYELIRELPESVWANTVVHSDSGRLSLDEWLEIYERHVPVHIAQMRAVYETWRLEIQEV